METKKTYYHLVLDRSGSMADCWEEAKRLFTEQLQKIRGYSKEFVEQEIFFSYCIFEQNLIFSEGIEPISAADLNINTIQPQGRTALYDAIGRSVDFVKRFAGKALQEEGTDVVMLVLTDGHENASTGYCATDIQTMIHQLKASDQWTFLFLGADIDIMDVTKGFGLGGSNMMSMGKGEISERMKYVNEEMHSYFHLKSINQKKRYFFDDGSEVKPGEKG